MTDSFDDDVEAWMDRLDRGLSERVEADAGADTPRSAFRKPQPGPVTPEPPPGTLEPRPTARSPEDLEGRLAEQLAMVSSARRELARTETLIEMMREITAEVRSLRQEVGRAKDVSSQVRALRHDVDEIKSLLTRLREIAAARRKTSR